jgi:tetratricopeptide (TPR) repeat protein
MDLFHEMLDDEGVAPEQQTEVLPLLRMVSLLDPTMTDAHDIIAWDLYKGHGQTEQALKILDEALSRSEGSFSIHFRRALILYQTGRYDDALQSSKRALEFSKDEFDVLNANRMLYWSAKQVGDKVAMRRALGALRASRPDDELWKSEEAAMNAPPK